MCNESISKITEGLVCPKAGSLVEYRISKGLIDLATSSDRGAGTRAARTIDAALVEIAMRKLNDRQSDGAVVVDGLKMRWKVTDYEQGRHSGRHEPPVGGEQFSFRMWLHGERPSWSTPAPQVKTPIAVRKAWRLQIGQRRGRSIILGIGGRDETHAKYRVLCECGRLEAKALQQVKRVGFLCAVCRGGWCVTCGAFLKSGRGACTINCSPECSTAYRLKYFQIHKKARYRMAKGGTTVPLDVDAAALHDIALLETMMGKNHE